jgi:aromatic ring-opening dioxygenase LigB subunit
VSGVPVAAAIVPHAPLLLEELHPEGFEGPCGAVARAVRSLRWGEAEAVVVVSPHGAAPCVYARVEGSLKEFGLAISGARLGGERLAKELAATTGLPLLESPCDHGVLIPTLLGCAPGLELVGVSLGEGLSRDELQSAATLVARAIESYDGRVGFAASAHSGAALSPSAPLAELEGAVEAESAWIAALRADVGSIEMETSVLARVAGSCGAAPLRVLAALGRGRAALVHAYERPFGVGYIVASVSG